METAQKLWVPGHAIAEEYVAQRTMAVGTHREHAGTVLARDARIDARHFPGTREDIRRARIREDYVISRQ
jgi:hypothetical protein